MARYSYLLMTRHHPGKVEAFRQWYHDQHLPDVARVPGVVGARLFMPDFQMTEGLGMPDYSAIAIYDLESDDPKATINAMFALAGTDAMPISEAMDLSGMAQFIMHEVRAIG